MCPLSIFGGLSLLSLAAERSPLCPLALDRPTDCIKGLPSTPNTPAMRAAFRSRAAACAAGSHLTPLVSWQTDGSHFPHLEPPQETTISSPVAFPRQHAEAGQAKENDADAAYDGADVVPLRVLVRGRECPNDGDRRWWR